MENQALKKRIMRRVYRTWFVNRAKPIIFWQLPLMFVFLAIEHEYVAFKAVASNAVGSLNSPTSVYYYVVSAFASAEPLVAFLAAAIGLFSILAITSVIRNITAVYGRKAIVIPIKIDK